MLPSLAAALYQAQCLAAGFGNIVMGTALRHPKRNQVDRMREDPLPTYWQDAKI